MTHAHTHMLSQITAPVQCSPPVYDEPHIIRGHFARSRNACLQTCEYHRVLFVFCFSSQARVSSFEKKCLVQQAELLVLRPMLKTAMSLQETTILLSLSLQTPLLNPSPSSRTIANVKQLFPLINPPCECLCTFSCCSAFVILRILFYWTLLCVATWSY